MNEMQNIWREITRLRQEVSVRPVRLPPRGGAGGVSYDLLVIGDGNIVQTVGAIDYYGLKRPSSPVLEVPTLAPSGVAGSEPDGLTIGTLNGSPVWVGLRLQPNVWSGGVQVAGTVTLDDFPGDLTQGTPCFGRSSIQVPVNGSVDVYATVYNPWAV